jgi:NAD(P)H-hydrate epimerase
MERASSVFTDWFSGIYTNDKTVYVLCGTGNNGGDGLGIARLLHYLFFDVHVFICKITDRESPDFLINLARLPQRAELLRGYIREGDDFIKIPENAIIIDAILGSGLSRPVMGYWADFFNHINNSGSEIVSVDIPSGMFCDAPTEGGVIKANRVLSFEIPKLAFLMPENQRFIHSFEFKTIGLLPDFLNTIETQNQYVNADFISPLIKKRDRFDHKGTYGHALIVAGSFGMAGAGVLAAKACLRTGVGLLTLQTPQCNRQIVQIAIPEAMVRVDADEFVVSQNVDTESFSAIGIGCGIGKAGRTAAALKQYLTTTKKPLVIDADALNIIAENPDFLNLIPENSILTPHPKEFERLFGKTNNSFERLEFLREKAKTLKINILLKGAFTTTATTEGVCYFNATGNPGMATAGSGDVLTGIITSLLAQGYAPDMAAVIGAFIHGMAGDIASQNYGQTAMIARDIVEYIGQAFKNLTNW